MLECNYTKGKGHEMATMCKYKVGYIAKDGTNRAFGFKSDRKMIVSARNRSGYGLSFGHPWCEDMAKAISKFMQSDSTMKRCGGIKRYRYAMNVDTGQFVEAEYIV